MYKLQVPSDRYKAKMKKIKKEYSGMMPAGMRPDYEPVDLNRAFVPLDKSKANSNLKKTAESTLIRFGLTEGGV